jgi:hypothetical protein
VNVTAEARAFLLDGTDPSVQYFALRDLFDRPESDGEVVAAREKIGAEGWTAQILAQQQDRGHWEAFHEDGGELYIPKYIATNWRAIVLSDLGLTRRDPRVVKAVDLFFRYWSGPDGVFGEPGSETCITGNLARMLLRFGYGDDPRLRDSLAWLVRAQKEDGGWHCFPSDSGTLDAWEALAAFAAVPVPLRSAEIRRSIERGAEFYLERGLLRETDGSSYPPWNRLHYPNHYYYDLLVGLDALTALGYGTDRRLRPALHELEKRRNSDGSWNLDALQPDLEPQDEYHPRPPFYPFALEHPGLPSRWITLTALRVLRRAERL